MALSIKITTRREAEDYEELFLECPHALAQQSPFWADALGYGLNDVPYFVVAYDDGKAVGGIPLYHSQGSAGGILTSVPDAGPLGGILCRRDVRDAQKAAVYDRLTGTALDLARELGCAACTVITDPFEDTVTLYQQTTPPAYDLENFCQAVEIQERFRPDGAYDAGNAGRNNNLRRNLRKSAEARCKVDWAAAGDFDEWYGIHERRHRTLGVAPLPKGLLKGILEALGLRHSAGLAVARINGLIVGGGVYVWHRDVADVFILSCDDDSLRCGVNYAITDFSLRFLRERGVRIYNWQSSQPGSGVFDFKAGWGSVVYHYHFLTWTFPGFEKFLALSPAEAAAAYPRHYVAPYPALVGKIKEGKFRKADI